MDRLTNNGIGRRDDRSIDTCMRGLLMEFENNECMKNLLGQCKAIVISSGIDFAFLIMGGGNGSISQFKTFLRPFRTSDYYRDDLGLIRVNGPLVIASCISLFIKKNCLGSTCDDAIIKALVGGIKDGLWRALLQYHKGYPIAKQEVSNTSEQDIYKAHFLKLYGESEPPKQYGVVAVDVRDKIRKVYEAAEKHRNLSEFTVIWHRLFGGQQNQVEDFKSSVHIDLNLLNLDWQGMTVENRNKFLSSIVCLGLEKMVKEGYKLEEEGQEDQDHQIHFSIARFGNRLTADPDEIRFLRDKQILIKKYLSEKYLSCYEERGIKPLGIAVFGEPGSGKSTGIKQIVKEIYGSDSKNKIEFIECNLAQFTSYEDLAKRLHDAQDAIISDKIPMIFLDEFDSYFENNQYGWFKYLLSLLQDGTFKLDNRIYHIGKSIIVCAGGMNRSFREFDLSSWTEGDISRNAVRQAYQMLNAKQKDRCRDIVERGIRNGIIDDDTFIENLKRFRTKKEIDELEKRINVLARRLNIALEAFAKGYDSEIEDMKEQIRILKRINTLVIELKEVEEISKGRDDSSISSREEELRKQLHNDIESYDYSHSNNLEEILDNRVIIEMAKMSDGVLRKFGRMGNFIIEHRKQKEAELRKNKEQFQRVKGPDMVSRLLGCMDIKGPNQVISDDLSKRDTLYLVRRAVTLRSVLEEKMDRIFLDKRARINPAVLYALLHIPKYYHGARSISAVIDMSVPSYRDFNSFEPAMVPPVSQLNMHLDGEKFYALMNEYRRKHKI